MQWIKNTTTPDVIHLSDTCKRKNSKTAPLLSICRGLDAALSRVIFHALIVRTSGAEEANVYHSCRVEASRKVEGLISPPPT